MMTVQSERKSAGDRTVDGLLAGMGAGAIMMGFQIGVGRLVSVPAAEILARYSPASNPIQGALLHLAISGVFGIIFGLAAGLLARVGGRIEGTIPAFFTGIAYGSLLWLMSGTVFLSIDISPANSLPEPTFAIAHLIYGAALGYWTRNASA